MAGHVNAGYHEVTTQKTLIYDLRSELTNLRNEFSKLITTSTESTRNSRLDNKPRSRYSMKGQSNGSIDLTSNYSPPKNNCVDEIRLDLSHVKASDLPVSMNYSRQSSARGTHSFKYQLTQNFEQGGQSSGSYLEKDRLDKQKLQFEIGSLNGTGAKSFSSFYSKIHTASVKSGKNNNNANDLPIQSTSSDMVLASQIALTQHKIKQLQFENKVLTDKNTTISKSHAQLESKYASIQADLKQNKRQCLQKQEQINKYELQVQHLSNQIHEANQKIESLHRDQSKRMETMKLGLVKDFEKDIERIKKEKADEAAIQSREISAMSDQFAKERDRALEQAAYMSQQYEKLQIEIKKMSQKYKEQEQSMKEFIQGLTHREAELEEEIHKLTIRVEQEAEKSYPAEEQPITVPNAASNQNQEIHKLQEKLAVYLANIDKQSIKIKQQRMEVEKIQRMFEDCNRAVCEKEAVVRNLMRELKGLEKELHETRNQKRESDIILDDYNQTINRLCLLKLNSKYQVQDSF